MVEKGVRDTARAAGAAVLDDAHGGDIKGAFGTLRQTERGGRRTWRQRLLALAAIVGPGLIVMVGDNDAGGVATYAQAGQNYGTSLLWILVLLVPVLIVNQEMVVRLGAVTGVGLARLIFERFGRLWGMYSVIGLLLLNLLTLATEFAGVGLGAAYFGVPAYVAVPVAALFLIGITVSGRFETWERAMFAFIVGNLLLIPMVVLTHPSWGAAAHDMVVPNVQGGLTASAVLLIIAVVGTTEMPWQLFFQQSNVVDKRITPRWLAYERADTVIGSVIVVVGAAAIMTAVSTALQGTPAAGHFLDAEDVARALAHHVSAVVGAMFALVLIDASVIGASAVTLSTSYAFGDAFRIRHSLHRSWREARSFYANFTGLVVVAAVIVLIPGVPLGLFTTAVQALAGVLLPGSVLFALLLCNDVTVLGPWINRPWLNMLAGAILAVLLMLSMALVVTTVYPGIDVTLLIAVLGPLIGVGAAVIGVTSLRGRPAQARVEREERESWRMPPLALLSRPPASRGRQVALYGLSSYLVVAVVLLLVKAVQLATGHG